MEIATSNEDYKQRVSIAIKGPAMDDNRGFNLHYLLQNLDGIKDLIEKTYLFSINRSRLNEEDLQKLIILIDEPKKGSFLTEILIELKDVAIPLFPVIAENGPAIWNAIKQAYDYLKLVIDTRKAGKEVTVEHVEGSIIVTGNNNTITINNNIPHLASKLSPSFQSLTSNIDGENITLVSLDTVDETRSINLTMEDNDRFKKSIFTSDDSKTFVGKISALDSNNLRGKIEYESTQIPFSLNADISSEGLMKAMLLSKVELIGRERVEIDPSKEDYIKIKEIVVDYVNIL